MLLGLADVNFADFIQLNAVVTTQGHSLKLL